MRKLAVGNWKMNGLAEDLEEIRALIDACPAPDGVEVVICPPATLLARMSDMAAGSSVQTGGQDCHAKRSGAHTGDIGAAMIRDAGADFVIVGHSERRTDHGETDVMVQAKALGAMADLLTPIVCIGETLAEREGGHTLDIIGGQIDGSLPAMLPAGDTGLVVAYEPVWAIGTGLTPTTDEIAEVHAFIRERLAARFPGAGERIAILYGGSVKPSNAAAIFAVPHVNGALVGGASLRGTEFARIVKALEAA